MKKIIPVLILLILFSCSKENPVPVLEFISITPSIATEYIDDITITIKYTDEDGDLGENNPDVHNLFVKDLRNDIIYHYRIPQLSPNDDPIHITGNFDVLINGTGINNGTNQDTVSYEIYAVDRSGNESNIITSSSVIIQQ